MDEVSPSMSSMSCFHRGGRASTHSFSHSLLHIFMLHIISLEIGLR